MRGVQEVMDEIASMTGDEITEMMREKNLKGRRNVSCASPLARYIKQETGALDVRTSLLNTLLVVKGNMLQFPTSAGAIKFLRRFDTNLLPDLKD